MKTPVAWYNPENPNAVISAAQYPHVLEKNKVGYLPYFLDSALVSTEWQDISTVKRDSTEVLAISRIGKIRVTTGLYLHHQIYAAQVDGEECYFTHWSPIPPTPPQEKS